MSALTDIKHLRENGFWPDNTVPQWALGLALTTGERADSLKVINEALFTIAERNNSDLAAERAEFQSQTLKFAAALRDAQDRVRAIPFARQSPPVGPFLLLIGANAGGVGRWRANGTLNILWSEPPTAVETDFSRWIALSTLLAG